MRGTLPWVSLLLVLCAGCSQSLPLDLGDDDDDNGPVPVSNLRSEPFNRRIEIRWDLPTSATGVEILEGAVLVSDNSLLDFWEIHTSANPASVPVTVTAYREEAGQGRVRALAQTIQASTLNPGDLDPEFANLGTYASGRPDVDQANGVFVHTDPSMKLQILVAGQVDASVPANSQAALWRLLGDGSPDPSFAVQGLGLYKGADGQGAFASDVVVDPTTQDIFAAGQAAATGLDFAVWRLNSAGGPVVGFGNVGLVREDGNARTDAALAVALHNGFPMVAGFLDTGAVSDDHEGLLARYLADGTPDSTWAVNGYLQLGTAVSQDRGQAIATHNDDTFFALRQTTESRLYFYDVNGNGAVEQFPSTDLTSIAVSAADAEVLVVGNASGDVSLWCYEFDRTPCGATPFDLGATESAQSVSLDTLGRAVIVGLTGTEVFVLRTTPDRDALDPSFGTGGVVRLPGAARAVALDPDDRIYVVGDASGDMFVVRLVP